MTQNEYKLIKDFIVNIKILVVKSQSYEVAAMLRDIEKTLIDSEKEIDTLNINKYQKWIIDVVTKSSASLDYPETLNLLNDLKQSLREEILNKILEK